MEDRNLDVMFKKLKNEIPVNNDLKQQLRKSFIKPKKRSLTKKAMVAVAVAAIIIFTALVLPGDNSVQKASAASLRVYNHISILNIGGGWNTGISEYNGTIYTPVFGKGIFAYDSSGFRNIYDDTAVYYTRVSPDGKELVFSSGGNISVMDIKSGSIKEILKGDESIGVYYEEPSWSPDGKKVIYVKRVIEFLNTHGFDVKESKICEIDLASLESNALADGSYPSYINGMNSIIYEREGKIIIKSLKNNSEKIADDGRFPSAAPDGSLIAYVKEQVINKKQVAENAEIIESAADIWIADTLDTNIKKKVTSNYPYHFISEDEWIKELQPSDILQVLPYNGAYSYYDPVWSSDSKSLFAIKSSNIAGEAGDASRIIRIDLTQEKLSSEDIVKKFIQALIVRDEDYAKSLMKTPVDSPLTISNPRQIGYSILSAGKEDGKDYVDAEVYWQYTANPYYQIVKSRYYMSLSDDGYLIDDIIEISNTEIYERDGTVYIDNGNKTEILNINDIPAEYMLEGISHRFSSLVYNEKSQTLIMAIQHTDEKGESISLSLLSYNVKYKKFDLIDEIKAEKGSVGVSNLSIDSESKYLAVDLFFQIGKEIESTAYVYNLQNKSRNILKSLMKDTDIDSVKSSFWYEDSLLFDVTGSGQTVSYLFTADKMPHVQTVK